MKPVTPDEFTVRPATIEDTLDLIELGNRLEGEAEFMLGSPVDPATGEKLIKASLESETPSQPCSKVFVAEADAAIVRICLCRELFHPAQKGVVQLGLGVDEKYRRQGIGRALIKYALEWASNADVHRIQLTVIKANTPAVKLYEQIGFVIEGSLSRAARIDDQQHDLYVMAKLFE